MSKRIPQTIRVKVIQEWLSGLPRNHIAKINGIGAGTVSTIIKEVGSDIPDLDLLRGVAVILKRNNLFLYEFAAAIRLKKVLLTLSISEEQVEFFLENIGVHCFKKSISHEEFIQKVEEVSLLCVKLGEPIGQLLSTINQLKQEIPILNQNKQKLLHEIEQLYKENNVTKEEIDKYKKDNAQWDLDPQYWKNKRMISGKL